MLPLGQSPVGKEKNRTMRKTWSHGGAMTIEHFMMNSKPSRVLSLEGGVFLDLYSLGRSSERREKMHITHTTTATYSTAAASVLPQKWNWQRKEKRKRFGYRRQSVAERDVDRKTKQTDSDRNVSYLICCCACLYSSVRIVSLWKSRALLALRSCFLSCAHTMCIIPCLLADALCLQGSKQLQQYWTCWQSFTAQTPSTNIF